ncbi:MAG: hypothetical protein LBS60_12575, partial [Deltaproteobacteria bacterium]|nr:hypothetical protein [Deltaproteobacteria bacterium]
MVKKSLLLVFVWALTGVGWASLAPAQVNPDKTQYQSSPFMSAYRTIPRVLLVLSKDYKMFQQAYNGITDIDGDGRVDTGFNPTVVYT